MALDNELLADRALGSLYGSALGDSIGIYTEFLTPDQAESAYPNSSFSLVEPVTPFFSDSHRIRFETRAWTDDTDHTILIILSFLRLRKLDQVDIATRLRKWCEQGLRNLDRLPMGLGKTVGSVVFSTTYLDDPVGTAEQIWEKSGRKIAPNGSVMRTAPVGVIDIHRTEQETIQDAVRVGSITHTDPRCAVSVAIVSALIRGLCRQEISTLQDVDQVIERAYSYVNAQTPLDRSEFEKHAYATSLQELVLCDRLMGYVYKCLGSALWCLRRVLTRQDNFKSAMVTLIMCGGDADTNGAVAGALMGALIGYSYLPPEWRDGMRHGDWLRQQIDKLLIVSSIKSGEYNSEDDVDTLPDGGKGWITEEEMKRREMEIMERILLLQKRNIEARNKQISDKSSWKFW